MAVSLIHPFLVIGEGKDEKACFTSLLKSLELTQVQVEEYGGKQELSSYLRDLPGLTGFRDLRGLCITRDVDNVGEPFYQPVVDILRSITDAVGAWGCPAISDVESIVSAPRGMHVGVFLMPGQRRDGTLEDLCLEAIASEPAAGCVEEYFRCLEQREVPRPKLRTMQSKAKVHAWLASREEADLTLMGKAAAKGYMPWEHPAFDPLKAFLRDLFESTSQPQG